MTSYAADLASKFSEQNRDTILYNERWKDVFPGVFVDPNKKRRDNWCLMGRTETCRSAGVGGGISGFGAWLLLIDDPVKDAEQANSPTYRKKVWDWFKTTSRTRLAPGGRIIVIMTRWHEDDLAQRLLDSEEGSEYTVLHLPALSYGLPEDYNHIALEKRAELFESIPATAFPDPLGRHKGKALWPSWFDQDYLLKTRGIMGHDFTALYQGHPTDPQGAVFQRDWFRPITKETLMLLRPEVLDRVRSYDLAWSADERADYTVGTRATLYRISKDRIAALRADPKLRAAGEALDWQVPPLIVVIEDQVRWQAEWDVTHANIVKHAQGDGTRYGIVIEAVASQNIGFKMLKRELSLHAHRLSSCVPERDKEVRAKLALKLASLGAVFILCNDITMFPVWAKSFFSEVCAFPHSKKDDQIDAFTQAINYWEGRINNILATNPAVRLVTTFNKDLHKDEMPAKASIPVFQEIPKEDPFGGRRTDGLGWSWR
jgi:phage terminase large subunit-like protein